jgi:dienelactone hydrolase
MFFLMAVLCSLQTFYRMTVAGGGAKIEQDTTMSKVLKGESSGERLLLQSRIRAALDGLLDVAPEVDMTRLCALGWCLGGHSILELGRMQVPGIKAMITFHGVFDGVPPLRKDTEATKGQAAEILICDGDLDPFVDKESSLKYAIETLQRYGNNVRLINMEGAKHGFTNPAQDYNPSDAFAYNDSAANLAWSETLAILKRTLS